MITGATLLQASNRLADQPLWVQALLVMGLLLVTASMLIGLRNRKRRPNAGLTAREQLERAKQREGLKRDLESLAVEIEGMARRVGAQLDNKAARLEALIDQAEAAAERLESARLSLLQPGHGGMASNHGTPEPPHGAPGSTPGEDRLSQDVARLADQGMDAAAIARAVDEPLGKVELILALRSAGS